MKLKYKCLVLDHDDTVVDSSASIHYPSFVEYLKIARPHLADKYTLEEYFEKNFDPVDCKLDSKEPVDIKISYHMPIDTGNEAAQTDAFFDLVINASNE